MANLLISEFPCTYRQNPSPSSAECPELRLIKWNYPEFPECLMKKQKNPEKICSYEKEKNVEGSCCLLSGSPVWWDSRATGHRKSINTLKLKCGGLVQWLSSYEQLMLLHNTGVTSQHPCNAAHSCLQLLLQGILPSCTLALVHTHSVHMHRCVLTCMHVHIHMRTHT